MKLRKAMNQFLFINVYHTKNIFYSFSNYNNCGAGRCRFKKKGKAFVVCGRYVTRGEGIVHQPGVWGWESEFHTKGSC